MKPIFKILFVVSILLSACSRTELQIHEPEKYAVIELDSNTQQLYENTSPTDLKFYEIQLLEVIVKYAIADHNQKEWDDYQRLLRYHPEWKDDPEDYIEDFDEYYRQYIPYINERGEKIVEVNCFCDVTNMDDEVSGLYWRTDLIQVNDGGNCFFNLNVNLSLKTFAHLMVNGV